MPNVTAVSIKTSDGAAKSGPGVVYWVAVSAGATGGAFQLNDSTDDSGTDMLNITVAATTTLRYRNICGCARHKFNRKCRLRIGEKHGDY